ncbi:hypothetical protein SpCBS45565_g05781 [Spizellomyces sp. 'palustris']|nr:hypothetical protein SpCBS45565_g05781 [Spizellomyces sp. 'palustris']
MARRKEGSPQSALAANLAADRRWVCTGTPMPNVLHCNSDEDEKDLQKLGSLLSDFLMVEPYASAKDTFRTVIAKPFLEQQFQGYEKLRDLMHRVMVRNRQEDIERDVKLPALYERLVMLDFGRYQRIIHNCLLSFFGTNAILSQREHQDYFFHPSQKKALREAVQNLFSSCFWYAVSHLPESVASTVENVEEGLQFAEERGYSAEDVAQLTAIKATLRDALNDDSWLQVVRTQEVVYGVSHCPPTLQTKAVVAPVNVSSHNGSYEYLIHAKNIEAFRKHVKVVGDDSSEQLYGDEPILETPKPRSPDFESLQYISPEPHTTVDDGMAVQIQRDRSAIVSTSSVKLTYLADQIIKYAPHEKIIVYAQFNNEIYYVHELCRLAKIRCILFHRQQRVSERAHSITTFNTSDHAPVIIMDTRLAAWGIDLSSASRVYFISPVWQHDMERQAIKRAHRIGCRRPVHVETLVIRGSVEEDIVKRRGELVHATHPAKKLTDDGKMRGILSSAHLINFPDNDEPAKNFARLEMPIALLAGKCSTAVDYYAQQDTSTPRIGQQDDQGGEGLRKRYDGHEDATQQIKRRRQNLMGFSATHVNRRVQFT